MCQLVNMCPKDRLIQRGEDGLQRKENSFNDASSPARKLLNFHHRATGAFRA